MYVEDGRGPLFWAYEYNWVEGIKLLKLAGLDENQRDINGKTPRELFSATSNDDDDDDSFRF